MDLNTGFDNYFVEEVKNDIKRIKNSDYDKIKREERSRRRMGSNSELYDDRRNGRSDTGLSGRRANGNKNENGGNGNFEDTTGLRGDRILNQDRNIDSSRELLA